MRKKLASMLSILFVCVLLVMTGTSAFSADSIVKNTDENKITQGKKLDISGKQTIKETDRIVFSYDADNIAISIKDKQSGAEWSSAVAEETIGGLQTSTLQKERIRSLLAIQYVTDKDGGYVQAVKTTTVNTERKNLKTELYEIENGIRLKLNFSKLGFVITLDLYLDGDDLVVHSPQDGITETRKNGIVSLEVLPALGAATAQEDGYILYPDGSGALYRFRNAEQIPESELTVKKFQIYADYDDSVRVNLKEDTWGDFNAKVTNLPVFGMKKGNAAFVAMLESGEADANISVAPIGALVDLARVYSVFTLRRMYEPLQSEISATKQSTSGEGTDSKVQRIDKEFIQTERTVRYSFLSGENADYSGMANQYRARLKERNMLNQSDFIGEEMPLLIDLVMGLQEENFLSDTFLAATTYSQAEDILKQLKDKNISNIALNLLGWNQAGYGEKLQTTKAESKLGGQKGLEQLITTASQYNAKLFLNVNFMDYDKKQLDFNLSSKVVSDGNGTPVSDTLDKRFLLNSAYMKDLFVQKQEQYASGAGLSFEHLGNIVYHDYNRKNPTTRQQTADYFGAILKTASEQRDVASYGGNLYTLSAAELLLDIPTTDSQYFISTESIPFYQMVVHGNIPYVSAPINLLGSEELFLKQVEYGCVPYYRLTEIPSERLLYTDHTYLYSTEASKWIDKIGATYDKLRALNDVQNQEIVSHARLTEQVFETVYQNGKRVLVNYGDTAYTDGNITVEAVSFTVVGE